MGTANTTIELNGKLYDARTGKILGDARAMRASETAHTKVAPKTAPSGVVMDGFTRRKPKPNQPRTSPVHTTTNLQKSTTLMRPAVKKPAKIVKSDITASKHSILQKHDPARASRAANAVKSSAISRYGNAQTAQVVKKTDHLPVVSQNQHPASARVAQLATSTETHLKQSVDIIEESLRNASAHLQQFDGRVKRSFMERFGFKNKRANFAAAGMAAFLLVGFFGWQNAPNLEMRVAAAKAGVGADVPSYRPAGFGLSRDIKSQPGKVAITFQSNSDNKKYTVTQTASNWSSDSLLSNHVLASKQPFQTYQDEGKTVYIYDNSNATWVNGGIWYQVTGDANLTSDQLLRIANSF